MQIHSNSPLIICPLILVKVEIAVGGDSIDGNMIVNGEVKHVEGRVPTCWHIMWHHLDAEAKFFELCEPSREDNGGRVLDHKCECMKLWNY